MQSEIVVSEDMTNMGVCVCAEGGGQITESSLRATCTSQLYNEDSGSSSIEDVRADTPSMVQHNDAPPPPI